MRGGNLGEISFSSLFHFFIRSFSPCPALLNFMFHVVLLLFAMIHSAKARKRREWDEDWGALSTEGNIWWRGNPHTEWIDVMGGWWLGWICECISSYAWPNFFVILSFLLFCGVVCSWLTSRIREVFSSLSLVRESSLLWIPRPFKRYYSQSSTSVPEPLSLYWLLSKVSVTRNPFRKQ